MARHKGKKRGFGRKNRAVAVAPLLPLAAVVMNDFATGVNKANAVKFTEDIIGYNMLTGKYDIMQATPFWGASIAGIVIHKAAAKVGVNRFVKKMTMGFLEL